MLKRKDMICKTDKTLRFMRCFEECVESLTNSTPIPSPMCFQRSKVYLRLDEQGTFESNIYLFDTLVEDTETYFSILNNFEYFNSDHVIDKTVVEYLVTNSCTRINSLGRWILITKIKVLKRKVLIENNKNLTQILCRDQMRVNRRH